MEKKTNSDNLKGIYLLSLVSFAFAYVLYPDIFSKFIYECKQLIKENKNEKL